MDKLTIKKIKLILAIIAIIMVIATVKSIVAKSDNFNYQNLNTVNNCGNTDNNQIQNNNSNCTNENNDSYSNGSNNGINNTNYNNTNYNNGINNTNYNNGNYNNEINSSSNNIVKVENGAIGKAVKVGNYTITLSELKNTNKIFFNGMVVQSTANNYATLKINVVNNSNMPINSFEMAPENSVFYLKSNGKTYPANTNLTNSFTSVEDGMDNFINLFGSSKLSPGVSYLAHIAFETPKPVNNGEVQCKIGNNLVTIKF